LLYTDLTSLSLPKLLRYEDRNSMAFSLESRLPFLDYRLVEFVYTLPAEDLISNGWSKWIFRQSMKGVLPESIRWRRSKLGFPTPEEKWLYTGRDYIRQLLSTSDPDLLSPYIQPQLLPQLSDLPDQELVKVPGLWRLVNLILWLDIYMNPKSVKSPDELQSLVI